MASAKDLLLAQSVDRAWAAYPQAERSRMALSDDPLVLALYHALVSQGAHLAVRRDLATHSWKRGES